MTFTFKRCNRWDELKCGEWTLLRCDAGYSAVLCCPHCGAQGEISGHTIFDDGTVHPSVICPNADCEFHDYAQLEGWTPGNHIKPEG